MLQIELLFHGVVDMQHTHSGSGSAIFVDKSLKIRNRWSIVAIRVGGFSWDWSLRSHSDLSGHLLPHGACAAAPRLFCHVKRNFKASFHIAGLYRPCSPISLLYTHAVTHRNAHMHTGKCKRTQELSTRKQTTNEWTHIGILLPKHTHTGAPSLLSTQEVHLPVSSHQLSSGDRAALELLVNAIKMPCWVKIRVLLCCSVVSQTRLTSAWPLSALFILLGLRF